MRALICAQFSPMDTLVPGTLPDPVPGEGEVVIRVAAAGVNFYDTLIVQGKYQVKPPLPFAPGGEVAGTIAAVGPGVKDYQPGQRVVAFSHYGGYAELCKAKAKLTYPLPDAVAFDVAAAGLVAYGTAWYALYDKGRLQAGETVLVLGAAGGVGLAAVQIARLAGAKVIAAASSAEKLEICRQAGADVLINYHEVDLKDAVKAATDGQGADVVIDVVGNPYTEAAVRATAWRGRVTIIGFAAGEIPKIPGNLLLLKGCETSGVFWDEFLRREPETAHAQIAAILAAFGDGSLKPPITARFTIEEGLEALRTLAERRVIGKIIVTP